jgi:hypothetical protein
MKENLNARNFVKIHPDTPCIKMHFDKSEKILYDVDMNYNISSFTKIHVKNICYDDHVLSCFYNSSDHPLSYIFPEKIIDVFKAFARCGMTSIIHNNETNSITLLFVPNTKIKHYKDGVIQ